MTYELQRFSSFSTHERRGGSPSFFSDEPDGGRLHHLLRSLFSSLVLPLKYLRRNNRNETPLPLISRELDGDSTSSSLVRFHQCTVSPVHCSSSLSFKLSFFADLLSLDSYLIPSPIRLNDRRSVPRRLQFDLKGDKCKGCALNLQVQSPIQPLSISSGFPTLFCCYVHFLLLNFFGSGDAGDCV